MRDEELKGVAAVPIVTDRPLFWLAFLMMLTDCGMLGFRDT
jgi:hypothetical protein